MFADRDAEGGVGAAFPSDWRKTMAHAAASCQTEPTKSQDGESQTAEKDEVGIQTLEGNKKGDAENAAKRLNSPSLAKFLARSTPMLERELQAALRSRAFDGYSLIEALEERETGGKLHTLEPSSPQSDSRMRASAVSWSSSSSSPAVAVAFEHEIHSDWCDHETSLCVWSLARRDFHPGQPHRRLDAPCCLTSVSFHPRDPSLLAAGGFTGEIFVWSAAEEGGAAADAPTAATNMRGHRERVTSLKWLSSEGTLLSAALDGKILLWSLDKRSSALDLKKAFAVAAERLPRSLRVVGRARAEVGVTAVSVNSEDGDIIIIGTEAGAVFQGSLASEAPVVRAEETGVLSDDIEWRDPITVTFSSHRGRVVDVQCSPFHRDIFASLGSDQEIRIHSLLNPQIPSYVIHREESGISSLCWSPSRPALLAAATLDGCLILHDLRSASTINTSSSSSAAAAAAESTKTLRASENYRPKTAAARGSAAVSLTAAAFSQGANMAAAADSLGRTHVWRLDSESSVARPSEIGILDRFAAAQAEE